MGVVERVDRPKLLEYSPSPPWHKRRAISRALILIALLLAAVVVWRGKPFIARQVQLCYWQNKCLTYNAPPDREANFVPEAWNNYYTLLSPPGAQSNGTAFLHERISPKGNRRLVAVDSGAMSRGRDALGIFFVARVFTPGTFLRPPVEIPIGFEQCRMEARPGLKILAGQVDANNPSHFTIEIHSPDARGTIAKIIIDGWLRDDDSALLEPRAPEVMGDSSSEGTARKKTE
jgi:hypothetical protein